MLTPHSFGEPPTTPRRHVTRREAAATYVAGSLLIASLWLLDLPDNIRHRLTRRPR